MIIKNKKSLKRLHTLIQHYPTGTVKEFQRIYLQFAKKELRPLIEKSMDQANVVNTAIQDNRFWLGKELYEHCEKFRTILNSICISFDSTDFRKLGDQAMELENYREDILTTLKRIK